MITFLCHERKETAHVNQSRKKGKYVLFRDHLPLARKELNCPHQSRKKERKITAASSLRSQSPPAAAPSRRLPHRLQPPDLHDASRIASSRCTLKDAAPPISVLPQPIASPRLSAAPPPYTAWPAVGDGASSYTTWLGCRGRRILLQPAVWKPPPTPPSRPSGSLMFLSVIRRPSWRLRGQLPH